MTNLQDTTPRLMPFYNLRNGDHFFLTYTHEAGQPIQIAIYQKVDGKAKLSRAFGFGTQGAHLAGVKIYRNTMVTRIRKEAAIPAFIGKYVGDQFLLEENQQYNLAKVGDLLTVDYATPASGSKSTLITYIGNEAAEGFVIHDNYFLPADY